MRRFSVLSCLFLLLLVIVGGCKSESITSINSHDGVSISFDNEGEGETTLILVHGWANNRSVWESQVPHFSEKYRVIAVDLPGFGESGNNRKDWSMQSFGKDISEIIQQLDLKNVVLVGFSMGASVVVEAASMEPDRIIGVVLVDSLQNVEIKIPAENIEYMLGMMMDLVSNPTKEVLVQGGFFKKNIDASYQRVLSFMDGVPQLGWYESLEAAINWQNENCINAIQAVKAPIIAINSDRQPTNVESFRNYAPGFKAKILDDTGHLVMWDNEPGFNQFLEESIREFTLD